MSLDDSLFAKYTCITLRFIFASVTFWKTTTHMSFMVVIFKFCMLFTILIGRYLYFQQQATKQSFLRSNSGPQVDSGEISRVWYSRRDDAQNASQQRTKIPKHRPSSFRTSDVTLSFRRREVYQRNCVKEALKWCLVHSLGGMSQSTYFAMSARCWRKEF